MALTRQSAFKQGSLTGLCGPYGITNAFSVLFPGRLTVHDASALAHRLANALPCGFLAIMREGSDRGQMECMLKSAAAWTREHGWPAWRYETMHPTEGTTGRAFWRRLAGHLGEGAAAIVGFGDHDRPNTRYEPHWTCVERVTARTIHCLDSDEYDRVRRSVTGVRPEPGWEIEDCFLLSREQASERPEPGAMAEEAPRYGMAS